MLRYEPHCPGHKNLNPPKILLTHKKTKPKQNQSKIKTKSLHENFNNNYKKEEERVVVDFRFLEKGRASSKLRQKDCSNRDTTAADVK